MRRASLGAAVALMMTTLPPAARAQRAHSLRLRATPVDTSLAAVTGRAAAAAAAVSPRLVEDAAARRRRAVVWSPVASLVVPGTGQLAMWQPHGVAYLAAEVYEWLQYAESRRDRNRSRDEFREIALVARRPFGGAANGPWSYYERVEERVASGMYNATPGQPLTPETDTSTFNGKLWEKAQNLFFIPGAPEPARTDPRFQSALAFYDSAAVKDGFLWSWRDDQLTWDVYKSAVARKNQATRNMRMAGGIIMANHLLSAIDALATVRLRSSVGPRGDQRIEAVVPWAPLGRPGRRRR
jgi:hypothetical protein